MRASGLVTFHSFFVQKCVRCGGSSTASPRRHQTPEKSRRNGPGRCKKSHLYLPTLRHELRNKNWIIHSNHSCSNINRGFLSYRLAWCLHCLFSCWKTSVKGRGIPGSRSRWIWSGLTSRPVSHLPPCQLSSPWGTSWTMEAFRTKHWIRGRSTSSSSWLS